MEQLIGNRMKILEFALRNKWLVWSFVTLSSEVKKFVYVKVKLSVLQKARHLFFGKSYVYWTVHHLDS